MAVSCTQTLWLPLLVEMQCCGGKQQQSQGAWGRWARHKLFDLHLLACIERFRCNRIAIPVAYRGQIQWVGSLGKHGCWLFTNRTWNVYLCQRWKPPTGLGYKLGDATEYCKPVYDARANRFIYWDKWNRRLQTHGVGTTPQVKGVTFDNLKRRCVKVLCIDVPLRRVFAFDANEMWMLDVDDGTVVQHTVFASPMGVCAAAIDPVRQHVYVITNDPDYPARCCVATKHSWDGRTHSILCTHLPHPIERCFKVVVHERTGMIAHCYDPYNLCVHSPDGHVVRTLRVDDDTDFIEEPIADMYVDSHLDVLCVAIGITIRFLSCQMVFAP